MPDIQTDRIPDVQNRSGAIKAVLRTITTPPDNDDARRTFFGVWQRSVLTMIFFAVLVLAALQLLLLPTIASFAVVVGIIAGTTTLYAVK